MKVLTISHQSSVSQEKEFFHLKYFIIEIADFQPDRHKYIYLLVAKLCKKA